MAIDIKDKLWDQAACKGEDIDIFFPEDQSTRVENILIAKAICAECPIKQECLDFALSEYERQDYGVWGGLTPAERTAYAQVRSSTVKQVRVLTVDERRKLAESAAQANSRRSEAAAAKVVAQLQEAIALVEGHLPEATMSVVKLRIDHPHASLKELGDMMSPPVSKDAVSGKIRRALELAKALRK